MEWNNFETFSSPAQSISWLSHSRSFFQHQVRQALREKSLSIANKRLDLRGIRNLVDRCTPDRTLKKMPNYWRGTFSAIISGGFRSAKHFLKAGLISDSTCPFCGQQEEDIIHILLDCPAWAATRLKYPGVDFEWLRQRNACTKLCAIPVVPAAVIEFKKW